jgi:hypothetical protein
MNARHPFQSAVMSGIWENIQYKNLPNECIPTATSHVRPFNTDSMGMLQSLHSAHGVHYINSYRRVSCIWLPALHLNFSQILVKFYKGENKCTLVAIMRM